MDSGERGAQNRKYDKISKNRLYLKLLSLVAIILLILAAFWFWGLSLLSNLDAFWKFFSPDQEFVPSSQKTLRPPPPYLNPIPAAAKDPKINLKGASVAGAAIRLYRDGKEVQSARADRDGNFEFFSLDLAEGANEFFVRAVSNNLESLPSKTLKVTLLKKGPKLLVSEPKDRAEYRQKENIIILRGQTEARAFVSVNGQKSPVDAQGNFSSLVSLSDGENKLTVEAYDEAGNKTTLEKTVSFSRTF